MLCPQTSALDLVSTLKAQHSFSSSALLQASSSEADAKAALYKKVRPASHSTSSKACACSMLSFRYQGKGSRAL